MLGQYRVWAARGGRGARETQGRAGKEVSLAIVRDGARATGKTKIKHAWMRYVRLLSVGQKLINAGI